MMVKDIVLDGKVIGKKYGIVKSLDKNSYRSDEYIIDSPCIIYDGIIYKMWYTGFDISNYRIHYATSEDGISWDKQGVVIDLGTDGETDDTYTHTSSVIFDGATYKMWYSGYDGSTFKLHYATSEDGIIWTKHGIVENLGADTEIYDIISPYVIYDGTMYKMWYNIYDCYNSTYSMYYTTSKNGIIWDKYKLVTLLDSTNNSEEVDIISPSIIFDGNIYKMLYSASDGSHYRICYATSEDGITWIKHGVVIPLGGEGDSDNVDLDTPFILQDGAIYKVWYCGFDDNAYKLHYAELSELALIK